MSDNEPREVRLLQAVKVPAGMQKVVRATLEDTPLKGPLMFTPSELSPCRAADAC